MIVKVFKPIKKDKEKKNIIILIAFLLSQYEYKSERLRFPPVVHANNYNHNALTKVSFNLLIMCERFCFLHVKTETVQKMYLTA
jgi:hypothetical protein